MTPPPAPTRLPLTGSLSETFEIRPTEAPSWDDDVDSWVCRYVTDDSRILPEFRTWMAVWHDRWYRDGVCVESHWEADDV